MGKIKVFNIALIEDIDGIEKISLVEYPAVERNFLRFQAESLPLKFNIDNEEKRIVTGVLMLADTPIARFSREYGEHYVVFTPDTIEKLVYKYFKEGRTAAVNLEHSSDVKGVYLFESYIKNSKRGISPKEFEDTPEGTWFGSFRVENDTLWKEIKEGTFKGFSIEGFLSYEEPQITDIEQLINYLNEG